ncbi:MAG TPA: gliding motility-associated C-terminal domain-containing protein [Chitinophagaceae bacterium]|nr:gliding motility-associated C-terminal domain-containing protein [Chitinophagaceae bacterium]
MKRILFLTLCCLFLSHTMLFSQKWEWAQKLGNTKSDKITCVKTDSAGYIWISGYFSTSINIGTNALLLNYTANAQSKEIFLAKLDSTGYCYWAKSGGQYFDDRVLGMDVDRDGNSVITGTFWEGSGINIGPLNITGSAFGWGDQCFIAKHDKNGVALWGTFVCSETGDDQGLDIATDKTGNHYAVGFMTGSTLYCGGNTVTAANLNTGTHKHSFWLAKFNGAGQPQWARTFGNLPWDPDHFKYIERDIAVCVDDSGGVYVTGGFDNTRPFGTTTLTSVGGTDVFVIKYDTAGTFKWVTRGGSDKDDWSNGICSDKQGHIYVVGEFRDSLIMDTVLVKNYDKRDAYIFKLDAQTGKPYWGKRAGWNGGSERGNDVWADTMCNVYVAGDINDSAKFGDNILIPPGKAVQAFVAKISPEGKWQWATTGGGIDSNDRGNAIAKGKYAQLYTCGFFRSTANYGSTPPLTSVGSSDGFFARLTDSTYNIGSSFSLHTPSDTMLCPGEILTLNIPKHAYFDYNPKTGVTPNADTSELTFNPTISTTYTLTGMSEGACPGYDTLVFTILRFPDPVAEFAITPKDVPLSNPVLNLYNLSAGATTYEWYQGATFISNNVNEKQTLTAAGDYCYTLFAYNEAGCMDSVTHCGTVYDKELVFFPNAFSPNGDQLNDEFGPVFYNVDFSKMNDFQFMIYNRWGELVFESDQPAFRWNGLRQDRSKMDAGVYFYYCKFTMPHGDKYERKGDVTLLK